MDDSFRSRFKGKQLGWSCWAHHKTEIESTDFNETFASLKSQDVRLYFLVHALFLTEAEIHHAIAQVDRC
jgi:hypothetical protein